MKFKEIYFHTVAIACSVGFLMGISGVVNASQQMFPGTVKNIVPNYKTIEVSNPQQQCQTTEVPIVKKKQGEDNIGTFVLGAIIGSAIGNAATDGNGAGTAGAILGGAIANEHQKKHNTDEEIVGYRQVQQCTTIYTKELKNILQNYTVTYEVLGQQVTQQTKQQFYVGQTVNVFINFRLKY